MIRSGGRLQTVSVVLRCPRRRSHELALVLHAIQPSVRDHVRNGPERRASGLDGFILGRRSLQTLYQKMIQRVEIAGVLATNRFVLDVVDKTEKIAALRLFAILEKNIYWLVFVHLL